MSYSSSSVDIEIQTLLHPNHGNIVTDSVSNVIQPVFNKLNEGKTKSSTKSNDISTWWVKKDAFQRQRSSDSESSATSSSASDAFAEESLVVNGADIGDIPAEFTVDGLRHNELPVIGTYVDKRIVPGFRYRVRRLGEERSYLFDHRTLRLESIGMGYAKRITMEGDTLNTNTNYFYSDTHSRGFGFSLQAVIKGDRFTIMSEEQHSIGVAVISHVRSQRELSSVINENGDVVKTAHVIFDCDVRYDSEGGRLSVMMSQNMTSQGVVVITKEKRARRVSHKYVRDVVLQHVGPCTFEQA